MPAGGRGDTAIVTRGLSEPRLAAVVDGLNDVKWPPNAGWRQSCCRRGHIGRAAAVGNDEPLD